MKLRKCSEIKAIGGENPETRNRLFKMLAAKMQKKGFTIGSLLPLSITIVVVVVALAIGADLLGTIQGTQTTNSMAYNISGYGLESLGTFGQWMPTIALVVVLAVIISILIIYLARKFSDE